MFSIRDAAVLTAYSAVLLCKSQVFDMILLTASLAAAVFLLFDLGVITAQYYARSPRTARQQFALPFKLMLLTILAMLIIPFLANLVGIGKYGVAGPFMMVGGVAASLPLLFNLDSRKHELNDKTLRVAYWSLWSAMVTAGLCAVGFLIFNPDAQSLDEIVIIRTSATISVIISVVVCWQQMRAVSQ